MKKSVFCACCRERIVGLKNVTVVRFHCDNGRVDNYRFCKSQYCSNIRVWFIHGVRWQIYRNFPKIVDRLKRIQVLQTPVHKVCMCCVKIIPKKDFISIFTNSSNDKFFACSRLECVHRLAWFIFGDIRRIGTDAMAPTPLDPRRHQLRLDFTYDFRLIR